MFITHFLLSCPISESNVLWLNQLAGPQIHQTTKATISDMVSGIQVARLPPALQDAIYTTWSIGLRFLWIDSLCIIQDDDFDRGREINKMRTIYRDATITISASISSTCREGFLRSIGGFCAPEPGFKHIDIPCFQPEHKDAIFRLKTDIRCATGLDNEERQRWLGDQYFYTTRSTHHDLYRNLLPIKSTDLDPIGMLHSRTVMCGIHGFSFLSCGHV